MSQRHCWNGWWNWSLLLYFLPCFVFFLHVVRRQMWQKNDRDLSCIWTSVSGWLSTRSVTRRSPVTSPSLQFPFLFKGEWHQNTSQRGGGDICKMPGTYQAPSKWAAEISGFNSVLSKRPWGRYPQLVKEKAQEQIVKMIWSPAPTGEVHTHQG